MSVSFFLDVFLVFLWEGLEFLTINLCSLIKLLIQVGILTFDDILKSRKQFHYRFVFVLF